MAETVAVAGVPAPVVASTAAPALKSSPKVEVQVSDLPKSFTNNPPPKPGSAKERMFKDLRVQTGVETKEPAAPEPKKEEARELEVDDTPDGDVGKPAAAPEVKEDKPADTDDEATPAPAVKPETDPKKKVSPWKLLEAEKKARAEAEGKIAEVEKRAIPEAKWKEQQDKYDAATKRLNELEEEIKFVNYSKSDEFKEKFQKPYQQAWSRCMDEIGDLTIQENGNDRAVTANDVLELVNMPLGKAHAAAVEKFGDLAPEVMAHRKEIRKLSDEQNNALDNARKTAVEREKTTSETQKKQFGELKDHVQKVWNSANDEAKADPKIGAYFTPRDGDQEGNQRLAKGYEMADRAFSESPTEPGITTEQREARVKRHAAVRNRSAAFGRLVYDNQQKDTKIAALEKLVAEYKGSDPARDGGQPEKKELNTGGSRKDQMFEALRKRAKPGFVT